MTIRVNPRRHTVRHDATALPARPGARRTRGADLGPHSIPPDERASDVAIYDAATGQLLRTEPPYREYALDDPRRPRSRYAQHYDGTLNLTRTPNPKRHAPADPAHPSADVPTT